MNCEVLVFGNLLLKEQLYYCMSDYKTVKKQV